MKKIIDARAEALYAAGRNDREIASEFGVSSSAVLMWRRKRGYPPANKKKEAPMPAVLKVPSVSALPEALREKINEAAPQTAPQIRSDAKVMTKVMTCDYDPLIYHAFDAAIARMLENGSAPEKCWRKLLAACERHIAGLSGYVALNEQAMKTSVTLAAIAAVDEVMSP